jgi:hypothetical protein
MFRIRKFKASRTRIQIHTVIIFSPDPSINKQKNLENPGIQLFCDFSKLLGKVLTHVKLSLGSDVLLDAPADQPPADVRKDQLSH